MNVIKKRSIRPGEWNNVYLSISSLGDIGNCLLPQVPLVCKYKGVEHSLQWKTIFLLLNSWEKLAIRETCLTSFFMDAQNSLVESDPEPSLSSTCTICSDLSQRMHKTPHALRVQRCWAKSTPNAEKLIRKRIGQVMGHISKSRCCRNFQDMLRVLERLSSDGCEAGPVGSL